MMIRSPGGFLEWVQAERYPFGFPPLPLVPRGISPAKAGGEHLESGVWLLASPLRLDLPFDPFDTMVGLDEPNGARA
jgi:hypothetical protein